jgi:hypothetical protein
MRRNNRSRWASLTPIGAELQEAVNRGVQAWGGWGTVLDRMWAGLEQGWNLAGRSGMYAPSLAEQSVGRTGIPAIRGPYPSAVFPLPAAPPLRGDLMPSFSFGGGLGGTNAALAGGGWTDTLNTGLGVLGVWAQNKAALKAAKQQTKQLRLLQRMQGGAMVPQYPMASNPFQSITPGVGGQPPTGMNDPRTMFMARPGSSPWGIIPTLPGGYGLPAADETPGWTWDRGTGDLGDAWNWITGGGDAMAEAVPMVRRTSPPRIVGSINNSTGKSAFYRYVGAPILFRGDLTTLKTVKKAVSKFGGLARATSGFPHRRRRR